ncbi:hypothetical protein STRTUCAR8_00151 [Streptomyces turgidiscabies Car8]|uniref:LysR substrate-binding domain-containing protein n=1 Tax=Streptomyces turgidiscabies (strain Car8) TaxID=698760 RepID=L7F473_STRT8|nr:hypothetical protein STRTUCAR8_00151 [Streptomyces turgidiscabies Car8]
MPLVLYDAHHATTDPARRRLDERAQLAGRHIEPVVEVEYVSSALVLVSEGFGGSVMCRAATLSAAMPANLRTVPFAEPLYDTLALVRLRGQVLPPPRDPGIGPHGLGLARRAPGRSGRHGRDHCLHRAVEPLLHWIRHIPAVQPPSGRGQRVRPPHGEPTCRPAPTGRAPGHDAARRSGPSGRAGPRGAVARGARAAAGLRDGRGRSERHAAPPLRSG